MGLPACPLTPEQLQDFEDYLNSLLKPLDDVHSEPNRQIFFDGGWGIVYDGDFSHTGSINHLLEKLKNHCGECKDQWDQLES